MSELAREFEAALVVGEEKAVAEAKRWNRIGYAVLAGTFGVALLWSSLAPLSQGMQAEPAACALPRRVLLIEDNADAAEMLALLLTQDGHHVDVRNDGPSGLRAALDARNGFGVNADPLRNHFLCPSQLFTPLR